MRSSLEVARAFPPRDRGAAGAVERQYAYTIVPGKHFLEYELEQQAAIVGDYFRFLKGQSPIHGKPEKNGLPLKGNAALDVYRRRLPFLNDIWT